MNILGINCAYHDSSACLVKDGQLSVAIEEERLTRRKHTSDFPSNAIARCLDMTGTSPGEIQHVAVSHQPMLEWNRKAAHALKLGARGLPWLASSASKFLVKPANEASLGGWFKSTFAPDRRPALHFVPHHFAHAIGTFDVSPYERAALLSVDGSGEWPTTFKGVGRGRDFQCFSQDRFPMSLGEVYSAVTEFCGFGQHDEGKTMGLAPLGDSKTFMPLVSRIFRVEEDMSIHVDLSYFNYPARLFPGYSKKFVAAFGPPRQPRREAKFEQWHLDAAAAFQRQLEECLLTMARKLRDRTREDYMVIAGGVSLNSVANGRIVRESGFRDVYLMPAAGDNGTAIGAAYYVYNQILGYPRDYVHNDPFVGTEYSQAAIERVLKEFKLRCEFVTDESLARVTAALLRTGAIVGWFQGRMEIGPRALGNRSILADPTIPGMKDRINAEVKHREAFRPFAPSCSVEDASKFFEQEVVDPFMLKVCYVRPDMRARLPAITHVDGTARLQTVDSGTNPRFHGLLKAFERLSGMPVLLNTSFNVMGEPIVESPRDAIRCFFTTGLDYLVLGNCLLKKDQQP
jgi:carbamoyltransferase